MIKHTAFERSLRNLNLKEMAQTMISKSPTAEQSQADILISSIRRGFKHEYSYSHLFVKAMKAYNQ